MLPAKAYYRRIYVSPALPLHAACSGWVTKWDRCGPPSGSSGGTAIERLRAIVNLEPQPGK
jgi:hypothetical protein